MSIWDDFRMTFTWRCQNMTLRGGDTNKSFRAHCFSGCVNKFAC